MTGHRNEIAFDLVDIFEVLDIGLQRLAHLVKALAQVCNFIATSKIEWVIVVALF